MESFASTHDMGFKDKDDMGTLGYLKGFKLFRRGGRKKLYNFAIRNDQGNNETAVFDFEYVVSTGKTVTYHDQTVYFKLDKDLAIPELKLSPEYWLHRIPKFFGMLDIDFLTEPGFSRHYLLRGQNEELIRKQFHPEIIHYFRSRKGWYMECVNYFLILYRKGRLLRKDQLEELYETGEELTALFKKYKLRI